MCLSDLAFLFLGAFSGVKVCSSCQCVSFGLVQHLVTLGVTRVLGRSLNMRNSNRDQPIIGFTDILLIFKHFSFGYRFGNIRSTNKRLKKTCCVFTDVIH